MLFIGNANSNVKKVIGNYSNVTIQGSANTENLHLYRRSYSDSQNTAVTADY